MWSGSIRPFRASDLIRIHENAFRYYGGISTEIVYAQERLLQLLKM